MHLSLLFRFSGLCPLLLITFLLPAQTVELLAPLPEPVSNNAVALAEVNGEPHVFSFAGIDTTKIWSGVHNKAFRYNVNVDTWDVIDPLPSPEGRIAAGASTVKNKIYIIGGYRVLPSGNEVTLNKVHRYDPETNTYLEDGAFLPVATDDHVQAVWRDSLIYVITGWNNNGNINNVQIYDPAADTWTAGTSVPGNDNYKVFGGSGVIVGDTLFYAGGASDECCNPVFPPTTYLRRGIINPDDPTEITWSGVETDSARGYRMGAATFFGTPIWIGGSLITYNFDGIDYNGTGGVPALDRAMVYLPYDQQFISDQVGVEVMDLRGVAQMATNSYIIAGGMAAGQQVTDRTFRLTLGPLVTTKEVSKRPFKLSPNPADTHFRIEQAGAFEIELYSLSGKLYAAAALAGGKDFAVDELPAGSYFVKVFQSGKYLGMGKLLIQH